MCSNNISFISIFVFFFIFIKNIQNALTCGSKNIICIRQVIINLLETIFLHCSVTLDFIFHHTNSTDIYSSEKQFSMLILIPLHSFPSLIVFDAPFLFRMVSKFLSHISASFFNEITSSNLSTASLIKFTDANQIYLIQI